MSQSDSIFIVGYGTLDITINSENVLGMVYDNIQQEQTDSKVDLFTGDSDHITFNGDCVVYHKLNNKVFDCIYLNEYNEQALKRHSWDEIVNFLVCRLKQHGKFIISNKWPAVWTRSLAEYSDEFHLKMKESNEKVDVYELDENE